MRVSRGSLIAFQRTRQLVERGCEAFVAYIVGTGEQPDLVTWDILIGGDATHAIPTKAAELPTVRLTELSIDVLPGGIDLQGFIPDATI